VGTSERREAKWRGWRRTNMVNVLFTYVWKQNNEAIELVLKKVMGDDRALWKGEKEGGLIWGLQVIGSMSEGARRTPGNVPSLPFFFCFASQPGAEHQTFLFCHMFCYSTSLLYRSKAMLSTGHELKPLKLWVKTNPSSFFFFKVNES
jgi:hypothetical protein